MSGQIEVGDTFTHAATGSLEYTASRIVDGVIYDESGHWVIPENCSLVRKAAKDPYAGLTLPTPPAGYRLAKWGEGVPVASLWWDYNLTLWTQEWVRTEWPRNNPQSAIFAVPIDTPASTSFEQASDIEAETPITVGAHKTTAPKSWQFRHSPWAPPQPKTLADCVEDTPVVVRNMRGEWIVVYRIGTQAFNQGTGEYLAEAGNLKFVRYLDPPQPRKLA